MGSTVLKVCLVIALLAVVAAVPGLVLMSSGGPDRFGSPFDSAWVAYVWWPMIATVIASGVVLPAVVRPRSTRMRWAVAAMLSMVVAYVIHWLIWNWPWLSGEQPLTQLGGGMAFYLVLAYLAVSVVTLPLAALIGSRVGGLGNRRATPSDRPN